MTATAKTDLRVLIETAGLTKRFGSFVAVADVDMQLPAASITALIGPNGAGKSTIVNLLSGQLLPTVGDIRFAGESVRGMHPHELAGLGIARTFQTPRLFPGMSAVDNVMLSQEAQGPRSWLSSTLRTPASRRREDDCRRTAVEWLEFVGITGNSSEDATALPIGTQRLVEVARALAASPTVLLLDEPAAGLDPAETGRLGELLVRVAATGPAIMLVEHDVGMVMSVADTVVVLDQGRVIGNGSPADVRRDPKVIEAYLGVAS